MTTPLPCTTRLCGPSTLPPVSSGDAGGSSGLMSPAIPVAGVVHPIARTVASKAFIARVDQQAAYRCSRTAGCILRRYWLRSWPANLPPPERAEHRDIDRVGGGVERLAVGGI